MKNEDPIPALRTPCSGNASLSVGAMGARQLTFTKIPTIDIAPLLDQDATARRLVAEQIGRACEEVGFFYIRNHGIAQSLIDKAHTCSAAFHHSSVQWREKVHVQNSRGNRGWLTSTLAFNDPDPELCRLSPAARPHSVAGLVARISRRRHGVLQRPRVEA